jgi:hypothetical protein
MIYDSMDVCGLSNPRVTRDSSSLVISESLVGSIGCRIHASPVEAVRWSFMFPLWALWGVESTRH